MSQMFSGCCHARKCETDAIWNGSEQKFVDSPEFSEESYKGIPGLASEPSNVIHPADALSHKKIHDGRHSFLTIIGHILLNL